MEPTKPAATDDQPSAATGDAGDSVQTSDVAVALGAVMEERDQLLVERADLQDRLLRRQAEFENSRRRAERERADVLEYAATDTVRTLLPIADDFERALKVESADKEYARGMELIYQRLIGALTKLGLEPIVAEGQPFDPNVHHAIEMVERDDVDDHTVIGEFQRGYNFRGRLLRPAMVRVAVKKGS
jgi:molecular chaperone GrpE